MNLLLSQKRMLLMAIMSVMTLCSWADNVLKINDCFIEPDVEEAYVDVLLENTDKISSMDFYIYMPNGLSIDEVTFNNSRASKTKFQLAYDKNNRRVSILDKGGNFIKSGDSNVLLTLKVQSQGYFKGGNINLSNITAVGAQGKEVIVTSTLAKVSAYKVVYGVTPAEGVELKIDEQANLNITLENNIEISALSFNVKFPEGLDFAFDEEGDVIYVPTARMDEDLSLVISSRKEDGTRTVVMPTPMVGVGKAACIEAGEGVIFSIALAGTEALNETSEIEISDFKVSTAGTEAETLESKTEDSESKAIIPVSFSKYAPGDVNADGKININDITTLVNIIMEEPEDVKKFNPDVNGDGKVDINDLTTLINIIMGQE